MTPQRWKRTGMSMKGSEAGREDLSGHSALMDVFRLLIITSGQSPHPLYISGHSLSSLSFGQIQFQFPEVKFNGSFSQFLLLEVFVDLYALSFVPPRMYGIQLCLQDVCRTDVTAFLFSRHMNSLRSQICSVHLSVFAATCTWEDTIVVHGIEWNVSFQSSVCLL